MFLAAGGYKHQNEAGENRVPMLGRGCLKLKPLLIDRFKVVPGLDNYNRDAVSFEYIKKPGWFVRARYRQCFIEKRVKETLFGKIYVRIPRGGTFFSHGEGHIEGGFMFPCSLIEITNVSSLF